MHKPTILIINDHLPEYSYLSEKYTLLYYPPTDDISPYVQAERILADVKSKNIHIDGVFALLDFHSEISSIIAEKLGLPHASTQSIYNAQNKAVFASFMKEAHLPYPDTTIFDITQLPTENVYPLFIRPIRGSFSAGAYIIRSDEDFLAAQKSILADTSLVPEGFELFLLHFDPTLKPVKNRFMAQQYINLKQFIVDGFVYDKKVQIFGITKATYSKDRKSFIRYDFPAVFPNESKIKLQKILDTVITKLGYNNAGFNMEFFLTPDNEIIIIELNTRITPGFLKLFETAFETSPFEMMIQISLGQMPTMNYKKTKTVASAFPLRLPYDCFVTAVPTTEEVVASKKTYDILGLTVLVEKNTKLSEYRQDAYSYCYGRVDIAGENLQDIKQKLAHFMKNNPVTLKKL